MENSKKFIWIGLASALIVAGIFSPFASSSPDGLERVGEDTGFIEWAQDNIISSLIPDYMVPGIPHEGVATALAGIIGVLLTFIFLYGIGKLITPKSKVKEGSKV
ncbi:cobalt/nickel transport protein [Geosporobacter subterraneus DSM 17957]|uniref:Cobalt/nickel transport protein n=1 Tax=Geosporobacter subterraneus DSM 17957 TaxID=1121919 RepID=A0A1M6IAC7_9FIRM|nr:PDGLE domain-containing protein [Geosporobacter subterraneus]SHJ31357.1 cobalt/nickel transport protein [Geosporobacter subterraneus DSM 17957]